MKLFETKKVEEVLQQTWTKYIDYKFLLNFIINAVPLYASNWPTIMQYKKIQGNKISISKVTLLENEILFWIDFEVPLDNCLSTGTVEISSNLNGNSKVIQIVGTVYC
jgi:hypothetical protein